MRIRIKITNDYFFYLSVFFAVINLYVAVFNRVISDIEKAVLVAIALALSFYAIKIKRMVDEYNIGDLLTIPRIHQFVINILLIVSLFLDLFYANSTPFMH